MKKQILFTALFFGSLISYGQTPIGHYLCYTGLSTDGYFDQIDFHLGSSIGIFVDPNLLDRGKYYDVEGNPHDALIRFDNNKIRYRSSKFEEYKTMGVKNISGLTIGPDSFLIAKNFYVEKKGGRKLQKNPAFMHLVGQVNDITFAKYYDKLALERGLRVEYYRETYHVKARQNNSWTSFPRDENLFKGTALAYFGDIPFLKAKIESGEYQHDDLMDMIKLAEYYYLFEKGDSILFDQYWHETKNRNEAVYKGVIKNMSSSILSYEFFENSKKIYSADYKSISPFIIHGYLEAFYPNGNKRILVSYDKDTPKEVQSFYKNGQQHYSYEWVYKNRNTLSGETIPTTYRDREIKYKSVKTNSGVELLDRRGNGQESFYDSIRNIVIHRKYVESKLTESFYHLAGRKIYQPTEIIKKTNMNLFLRWFSEFEKLGSIDQAIYDDVDGRILVALIMNEEGVVVDYEIKNSLHDVLNQLLSAFLNKYFREEATIEFKLKPYRHDGEPVFSEVIIPFSFRFRRFVLLENESNYNFYDQPGYLINQPFEPPPIPASVKNFMRNY